MFRRKSKPVARASMKHKFVDREDNRIALSLTATNPDFSQVASITMTASTLREYPCQLPGCAKPKDDPIHQN